MDIENKLDEDFLFYLSFTNGYLSRIQSPEDAEKCKVSSSSISFHIVFLIQDQETSFPLSF